MKFIIGISFILTLFDLPVFSQPKIECGGLRLLKNLKTNIIINTVAQNDSISKNALTHGLSIMLGDTSIKIIGFIVAYDCHSKSIIMDIHDRIFYGNKIKANDPFLKGAWKGDMLVIECINVSKKGKKYIAEPRSFWVTD